MLSSAVQEECLNCWYLIFYRENKFHSQLSWGWKSFITLGYDLSDWCWRNGIIFPGCHTRKQIFTKTKLHYQHSWAYERNLIPMGPVASELYLKDWKSELSLFKAYHMALYATFQQFAWLVLEIFSFCNIRVLSPVAIFESNVLNKYKLFYQCPSGHRQNLALIGFCFLEVIWKCGEFL